MRLFATVLSLHLLLVFALAHLTLDLHEKKKTTHLIVHHAPLQTAPKKEIATVIEPPTQEVPTQIEEDAPNPALEEVSSKKSEPTPIEPSPTLQVATPPPVKKEAPKKEEVKKERPKKVEAPKKEVATKPKKPAVTKKPAASTPKKDPAPSQKDKLYDLLQKSLNNLEKSHHQKVLSHAKTGVSIDLPKLASEGLSFSAGYEDTLVSLLEEKLEFPEKGKVKIKLTIASDGTCKQVEVIQGPSEKNKEYLKTALKKMRFPSLQKFFPKEDAHTFSITLTSEKSG